VGSGVGGDTSVLHAWLMLRNTWAGGCAGGGSHPLH